jgi:hypothetical protein
LILPSLPNDLAKLFTAQFCFGVPELQSHFIRLNSRQTVRHSGAFEKTGTRWFIQPKQLYLRELRPSVLATLGGDQ